MIPCVSHSLTLPADYLGLYVHIPFCVRKCRYCDFASQPLCQDPQLPDAYLTALAREGDYRRVEIGGPFHSIYLGGGTPTVLTGAQLRRLWNEVIAPFPRVSDAEITLEANPGTLTDDVLSMLAELPITRVSLGVQSFQPHELSLLGRIHTPQDVVEGVRALREVGISRISLDLMYGLPEQTVASWTDTLAKALSLDPEHLSMYALCLEEGTPFTSQVRAGNLALPGEEDEEAMLLVAEELTYAAGFVGYEVSNYARPGAYSRHNLGYWLGRSYLGLGAGATSTVEALRWRNISDPAAYTAYWAAGDSSIGYIERLSAQKRLYERVMLGLRLRNGFPLAEAEAACGCGLHDLAGDALSRLSDEGLLDETNGRLHLTAAGYMIANDVVARLLVAHGR